MAEDEQHSHILVIATSHSVALLENIFLMHTIIEAADGIALDRDGNIWVSANERNAIGIGLIERKVIEFAMIRTREPG